MYKILILCFLFVNIFASDKKILIPLYSYPSLWIEKENIFKKIKNEKIDTYVIINPSNGPGEKLSEDYIEGIRFLKAHNVKVLAYVYTLYGKRDPYKVKEDIYIWSKFYEEYGVSGIFFDETASDLNTLSYYKDLANYARSLDFNFVVLNPGYTVDKSYIDSKIANIIVTYENSMQAWNKSFPKNINKEIEETKLALLLHTLKNNDFKKVLNDPKTKNFTYLYITEDELSNPWDDISSKLFEEL
ncbi:MAG: hypothetical protein CL623_11110 [Arcobacter sp.]|nr:hypothetical protein [Arcobacter sp.]|tara:strand:- start:3013 stop:3744 length:732 start_codon:yes stop_codon:yes gene_type:complete